MPKVQLNCNVLLDALPVIKIGVITGSNLEDRMFNVVHDASVLLMIAALSEE
jgi:hypothetical protein